MLNKRDHRVTLGRRLFDVAGDLSDLELAYELRMSAAQISLCREAALPPREGIQPEISLLQVRPPRGSLPEPIELEEPCR